jgi:hypothetical protein
MDKILDLTMGFIQRVFNEYSICNELPVLGNAIIDGSLTDSQRDRMGELERIFEEKKVIRNILDNICHYFDIQFFILIYY